MQCSDFDAYINDLLDSRRALSLNDDAWSHQEACEACRSSYHFFRQLEALTEGVRQDRGTVVQSIADRTHATTTHDGVAAQLVRRCLERQPESSDFDPALVPLAQVVSRPVGFKGAMPESERAQSVFRGRAIWGSALAIGACTLLTLAANREWFGGLIGNENNGRSSILVETPSVKGLGGSELAATDDAARLAGAELHELAKKWDESMVDESVVAFDRGWQQIAVGRVRAHQLPGLEPAVYPITGAVEAFRKNMIVRNQNGLAAGLRW
jgi:hypothetical protein